MNEKKNIRQQMRKQRQSLTEVERSIAGLAVLDQLKTFAPFQASKNISVYLANDGELPLSVVCKNIWARHRKCLLPIIFTFRSNKLLFANYCLKTRFLENRYGISEPNIPVRKQLHPQNLDFVLMPLVAFDKRGNRIGMGGGFYDRSFAFIKRRRHWKKPILIGVAYDFQEVDLLQSDSWDIPLDGIVTPSRLIRF